MPSTRELEMNKLCDEVAELASHIAAATARWLSLLGRLDAEQGWEEGYKTLAHWLAWRCGMSLATARDHVRVAQRLRDRPLVREAFERGQLSYSKVRALMRLDPGIDEARMLDYALYASASQLETIVRGTCRGIAAEDGGERQQADRSFSWSIDEDGCVVFHGRLPAEQGAVVVRALEAARDELGPPPAELGEGAHWSLREATHSAEARRADAFIAIAQSALAERASSADVYQVIVHVDAGALRSARPGESAGSHLPGDAEAGDRLADDAARLADGTPLSSEAARRLTCDASVVTALERDGTMLAFGRKTRIVSTPLRRALGIRDNGCAFPGCAQRHHTDAHHIEHWADGGATDLENCIQLCRFHHTLVHRGLFTVRRGRDGFSWFRADGTRLPQAPRQPRGDCDKLTRRGGAPGRTGWSLHPRDPMPRGALLGWAVEELLETRAATPADVARE